MKFKIFLSATLCICFCNQIKSQSDTSSNNIISKGLQLHPLQQQIGYRSNFTKKGFWDIKAGMTFSALPFFVLEFNRCHRFVNREQVKVYSGLGLTLDSYVPGIQVPLGIEFMPVRDVKQLTIIAEVSPKMTFGPTNFVNIIFSPHIGLCYYLKAKPAKK